MFEVNWLVDRMHVATPRLEVLMEFMDRMKASSEKFPASDRTKILRHALRRHRQNVGVYTDVVAGRF
jgi:hypothetical protein